MNNTTLVLGHDTTRIQQFEGTVKYTPHSSVQIGSPGFKCPVESGLSGNSSGLCLYRRTEAPPKGTLARFGRGLSLWGNGLFKWWCGLSLRWCGLPSGQSGIQCGHSAVRSQNHEADHPISTGQNSTNGRSPLRCLLRCHQGRGERPAPRRHVGFCASRASPKRCCISRTEFLREVAPACTMPCAPLVLARLAWPSRPRSSARWRHERGCVQSSDGAVLGSRD